MSEPPEFRYETKSQRETKLRGKILMDLRKQGFYAEGTNDRFLSGLPDWRMGGNGYDQLDVELKVIDAVNGVVQSGLTKIQFNTIRDMNAAGMAATALTYVEHRNEFVIHHTREIDLDSTDLYVIPRSIAPGVIDGRKLMELAHYYIEQEVLRGRD